MIKKKLDIGRNVDMVMETENQWNYQVSFHNRKTKTNSQKLNINIYALWLMLRLIANDKARSLKRAKRLKAKSLP